MYSPLGLTAGGGAGYLNTSPSSSPNALLRNNGQFGGFDNIGPRNNWFRGGWRDLLGRGTVKKQIDLGPMASANSMLQYKQTSVQSDVNPFTFF